MSRAARRTNHRVMVVGGLWFLSVVVYGLVYWAMWHARPDAFILNKEFNLTPIQDLQTKLWGSIGTGGWSPGPPANAPAATELDSLMGSVAGLDHTAAEAEKAMVPLRAEQAKVEEELKRALLQHSERMWANVEHYKSSAIAEEVREAQRQGTLVATLEERFGPNPPSHQAIVLAEARVSLAYARYREAAKAAEVGDHVLKNLGSFADTATASEVRRLEELLRGNSQRQSEVSRQLMALRQQAHDQLQAWYAARQSRLLWVDFLYFSVGVSTTTTFGDIIPNSRVARIAVLTQLVISVLLVGYLVSLIASREERRAT